MLVAFGTRDQFHTLFHLLFTANDQCTMRGYTVTNVSSIDCGPFRSAILQFADGQESRAGCLRLERRNVLCTKRDRSVDCPKLIVFRHYSILSRTQVWKLGFLADSTILTCYYLEDTFCTKSPLAQYKQMKIT